MNKPPPSARVLATIYACSERSIRNYRAEGAPLDDPTTMWSWWSSRKNMPRAVAAKGLDAIKEAYAAVVSTTSPYVAPPLMTEIGSPSAINVPMDLPAGAQHELRWLEALAVEARHNLIRARGGGDPMAMKQALDAYLKITEGLRKFDNQVDPNRRDGGEVVTKAQVSDVLTGVVVWLSRGVENLINESCLRLAECDQPEQVYALVAESMRHCLDSAMRASMASQTGTPAWVREALMAGL